METERILRRRKRKTPMSKAELAIAFGFSSNKFVCDAGQLEEKEIEKRSSKKMKKFSDIVSVPKARESPVQKKKQTFKIAKSDDEQMLAFGWANISIRSDGEVIEDWQEDIIEPADLENAAYEFVRALPRGRRDARARWCCYAC